MQTLTQILLIILGIAIVVILYRSIRYQPEKFSKENLNKSAYTMALLALGLIAFVAFLVIMLRASG